MKAMDIMRFAKFTVRRLKKLTEYRLAMSLRSFIIHRISGLPVVNDRNEVVAYISDGDIMRYIGQA